MIPRAGTFATLLVCAVAIGDGAAQAGPAQPSVSVTGTELNYSAGAGQANRVTVTPQGAGIRVKDQNFPLAAGPGCTPIDANTADCGPVIDFVDVEAGDGEDVVDLHAVPACPPGTTGCDEPDARIVGGEGNDTLVGGGGDDVLYGQNGDDFLRGGENSDLLSGGDGTDTVDYSTAKQHVVVTLNGSGDDGEPGDDGDNVQAENVRGGPYDDRLTGDAGANVLDGRGGDDLLDGGAGPDDLAGGDGFDRIDYSKRLAAVVASLDGSTGDGEAGEGDLIRLDVEGIDSGSGDDVLTAGGNAAQLRGGGGKDRLTGGPGGDVLEGDDGQDSLVSGEGPDVLQGGRDDDHLDGGSGADIIAGNHGVDTVDYRSRTGALFVDFYDVGLDGEVGEEDVVRPDVEVLEGGSGNDDFVSHFGATLIRGNAGNDRVQGNVGDDLLDGGPGDDNVAGAGGSDLISGGSGTDVLEGGNGSDTMQARDGAKDTINCGAAEDTVIADAIDVIATDCEKVDNGRGPAVSISLTSLVASPTSLRVRIGCPSRTIGNCRGTATVTARKPRRRLGRRAFAIAPGRSRTVVIRFTKAGRTLVARLGTVRTVLSVTTRDGAGNRSTRRRSVTIG